MEEAWGPYPLRFRSQLWPVRTLYLGFLLGLFTSLHPDAVTLILGMCGSISQPRVSLPIPSHCISQAHNCKARLPLLSPTFVCRHFKEELGLLGNWLLTWGDKSTWELLARDNYSSRAICTLLLLLGSANSFSIFSYFDLNTVFWLPHCYRQVLSKHHKSLFVCWSVFT